MKRYVKAISVSQILLSILTCFLGCSTLWAQPRTIEGLKYWKVTTNLKQSVHLIEVDPAKLNITLAHANEKALGRETVTSIAKRHKAIAAINGGFFRRGEWVDGLPAGVLKIQGQWYGIAYRSRGAIGWSYALNTTFIDRIQTQTRVFLNHKSFPVYAVNQPGLNNKSILYTDAYGPYTDSTPNGTNIIIQNNRIIGIQAGRTPIPKSGYVLAIGANARYPNHPIDIGNLATVTIEVLPTLSKKEHYLAWQMADNILGGAPVLLYHGKIMHDHLIERLRTPFMTDRYARTAVGTLKNGHWLFAVVEQSALTGSPGMTIAELASFMKSLNCEYALNLDGGGSSTLYINNAVINHPDGSDEEDDYMWSGLRSVADAILILPKKK